MNFTHFWISSIVRNILEGGSRKGSDVIQEKRTEFHSLSIGGIVKNIVDAHGSRENRDSNRESQVNFTHFTIGGSNRKFVDRRSTEDTFSR